MIENKEKVKYIEMYPKARCFCPIGKAWYTNRFKVSVFPRDCYFDYLDVENFIKEEIEGKSLTIEGACKKLYDYLKKDVEDIQVESHVNDAVHFPVKVLID